MTEPGIHDPQYNEDTMDMELWDKKAFLYLELSDVLSERDALEYEWGVEYYHGRAMEYFDKSNILGWQNER